MTATRDDVIMLSLFFTAPLSFSSMPEHTTGYCVCGNYPLYASMDEAGHDAHCMSFFGTANYMPHGGSMDGGDCPADYADHTPDNADCSTAFDGDVCTTTHH